MSTSRDLASAFAEDQAAREAASTGESSFIDAAAGTGKTTTIVARIAYHVVIEGGTVDRIAAATFTLAAAAELRAKVRQCLEQVLAWTRKEGNGLGPAAKLVTSHIKNPKLDYPESDDPKLDYRKATERCEAALRGLDQAPWGTLHSLCLLLVREGAPELAVPAGLRLRDDNEHEHEQQTAAEHLQAQLWLESWWLERVGMIAPGQKVPPEDLGNQVSTTVTNKLANAATDQVVGQDYQPRQSEENPWLTQFSRKRDEIRSDLRSDDWAEFIDLTGHATLADELSSMADSNPKWLPGGSEYDPKQPLAVLALVASDKPDDEVLAALWPSVISAPRAVKDWRHFGRDAQLAIVRGKGGKAVERFRGLQSKVVESKPAHQFALAAGALVRQAADNASQLHDERKRHGRIAFDDAVALAITALSEERFDLVVIDEVQDSDPLQHRLLQRFDELEIPVVVVGDERQSIYGFRNARPELFAKRRDRQAESAVKLTRTFRHHRGLADGLNQIFATDVANRGVTPPEALADGQSTEGPPIQLIVCEKGENAKSSRAAESRIAVEEIEALVSRAKCRWRDVAILLPTRSSLGSLRTELRRAEIPFVVSAANLNWATDGARGLAAALQYRVNETELARAGFALSPWIGLPLADVASELGEADGKVRKRCDGLLEVPIPHGADAATATRILFDELQVEQFVQGLAQAGREDLAQELFGDARFVLDQACEYSSNGGAGLVGFVREVIEGDAGTGEDRVKGASAGDRQDAVTITTVHSAKGLEFPHVVVMGLSNKQAGSSAEIIWPTDADSPLLAKLSGGLTTELPGVRAEKIQAKLTERSEQEADRLLYVALTRASRTLTILVRGEDDPDEGLSYLQNWWSKSKTSGGSVSGMEKMLGRRLHELPDSPEELAGTTLLAGGRMVIRTPVGIEDASPVPPSDEVTWQEAPEAQSFAIRPTITGSQYHPNTDADAAADRSTATELAEQPLEAVPSTASGRSPLSAQSGESDPSTGSEPPEPPSASDVAGGMQFGTAVHEAVQRFGILGHDVEAEDAPGVMRDIAARTSPRPEQVQSVATAALAVLRSEPLRTAGREGWRVEYEWPVLVPMTLEGEDIVGGGIIDILVITPDGTQIYDIKTDRSVPAADLIEHYRPQLTLYADAVEAVGGGPVTRAALIRSDGSVVDLVSW